MTYRRARCDHAPRPTRHGQRTCRDAPGRPPALASGRSREALSGLALRRPPWPVQPDRSSQRILSHASLPVLLNGLEDFRPKHDLTAPRLHAVNVRRIFRSEEPTSELQSLMRISYADFCLKKKNTNNYI